MWTSYIVHKDHDLVRISVHKVPCAHKIIILYEWVISMTKLSLQLVCKINYLVWTNYRCAHKCTTSSQRDNLFTQGNFLNILTQDIYLCSLSLCMCTNIIILCECYCAHNLCTQDNCLVQTSYLFEEVSIRKKLPSCVNKLLLCAQKIITCSDKIMILSEQFISVRTSYFLWKQVIVCRRKWICVNKLSLCAQGIICAH